MPNILRQETPEAWLERMEAEATQHKRDSVNSWMKFCKSVLTIQDSELWKQPGLTWEKYVRLKWDLDSSRIRHYKIALPYAEGILDEIQDAIIPESDIRKLKQVVDADNPLMPQVYRLGKEVADELETHVKESFFQHALEVLEEEQESGFVDIGVQVPGDFENMRTVAVLKKVDEAKLRLKARLMSGKRSIQVTAKRIGDNQYLVTADEPLPETFQFKLWKDEQDV